MKIAVLKSNKNVVAFSEKILTLDSGYTLFIDLNIAYNPKDIDVIDEKNVPENIEPYVYNYSKEKGFYLAPEFTDIDGAKVQKTVVQKIQDDYMVSLMELGVL